MDDVINNLIKPIAAILIKNGWKLTTAESCTGGGLSYYLTELVGSSAWFDCGFVTYSELAKQRLLNVPAQLLASDGVVSQSVATAMAIGALANSQANVALAITGLAGPQGNYQPVPVGTVCFGWAMLTSKAHASTEYFSGDRHAVRITAIETALRKLLDFLHEQDNLGLTKR